MKYIYIILFFLINIFEYSEFARVFGIDFYSVITRGSQFKVESIMARINKPENFIMVSPRQQQVNFFVLCLVNLF